MLKVTPLRVGLSAPATILKPADGRATFFRGPRHRGGLLAEPAFFDKLRQAFAEGIDRDARKG